MEQQFVARDRCICFGVFFLGGDYHFKMSCYMNTTASGNTAPMMSTLTQGIIHIISYHMDLYHQMQSLHQWLQGHPAEEQRLSLGQQ